MAAPFLLILLGTTQLGSAESSAHKSIRSAAIKKLSEYPYWLTLLHYRKTILSHKSTIDDPDFFLCETGNKDPAAEMAAIIAAFSEGDPSDPAHPINRFPARLNWLQTHLSSDTSQSLSSVQSWVRWLKTSIRRRFRAHLTKVMIPAGSLLALAVMTAKRFTPFPYARHTMI